MLNYSLHENLLTERTDDYAAQTHASAVYTREQFIDLMLQRGTLVTKTDIVAVLNNIEETARYIIENGGQLNLPLFNTSFSISGVFDGILDTFDPNRHKLHVTIHNGTLLRDAEKAVKLAKVNAPAPQPQILEVKDSVSGQVDTILTAGGAVEIDGINIKIVGDNEAVGLYFVAEDTTETKAVTLISNKPSLVLSLIPALASGNYRIKIVTQYSGGKDLKEPKTTIYSKTLQVQ
ncbi:hypothetical protein EZS27_008213 [termite gut metagenome]|uniref:Uncharacterized protein n=1 Tax=termite gut metagenome TaxID=433724 RepID=A0A5J4SFP7_9ZZZZ